MLTDVVLIADEKGTIENIVSTENAGDDVQQFQGILSPGFINCHCHLELSHLRGRIPEGTGLIDFVMSIVTQRHSTETEIQQAITQAEDEMLANGIVAVGDISNNDTTASQKALQRLAYYNFVEVSGWLPAVADARINNAINVKDVFDKLHVTSPKYTALVPHAPYSVSEKLWQLLQTNFAGKTISIHNQETSFEDELFLQGTGNFTKMFETFKMTESGFVAPGKTSLASYFTRLNTAKNVLLVHNTFTSEADVQYATSQAAQNLQQLYFCLCVNANLYIENATPPLQKLLNNNCSIVLGTDSLASNWSLSILDEMKTLQQKFDFISIEQLLQFATLNGAKALQMQDKLGSFNKGKQPGVLLINDDLSGVKRLL